jgi:hypothetical protein
MEVDRRKAYRVPLRIEHGRLATFYPIGLIRRNRPPLEGELVNISTEGVGVLFYDKVRRRKRFWILLDLPGPLKGVRLRGKVVWAEKDPAGTHVGIQFLKPSPGAVQAIARMAHNYKVCEANISVAIRDACRRDCAYWDLCRKPIKKTDAR